MITYAELQAWMNMYYVILKLSYDYIFSCYKYSKFSKKAGQCSGLEAATDSGSLEAATESGSLEGWKQPQSQEYQLGNQLVYM